MPGEHNGTPVTEQYKKKGKAPDAVANVLSMAYPKTKMINGHTYNDSDAFFVTQYAIWMVLGQVEDNPPYTATVGWTHVKYTRLQSCVLHKIAQTGSSLSGVAVFGGIAAVCGIAMLIARKNRR